MSKFCTIDLREKDLCFPAGRPAGQEKRRDEFKKHTYYTRVWGLYSRPVQNGLVFSGWPAGLKKRWDVF